MPGNNLAVKVTADIADAQAKLAVLNAEFKTTQAQISTLARAGAAGTLGTEGEAQLRALTQRTLELQAAAQPLAVSISEAGFAVKGLGSAAMSAGREVGNFGEHNATAVRYVRELFDEISSGRTRYLPSTLAALGQQTLHMNLAMLAAVGGAAALAGGLLYLGYRAIEAKAAIQNLDIAAQRTGNFDLSAQSIQHFVDAASSAANVTKSDAQTIANALVSIPDMARPTFEALSQLISGWVTETGQNAKTVAKDWAKMFSGSAEAAAQAAHLSQAEIDAARSADQSGNAYKVQASQLQTLVTVYERAAQLAAEKRASLHTGSVIEDTENLGRYVWGVGGESGKGGVATAAGREAVYNELLKENTAESKANVAAIRARIAALEQMSTSPEMRIQKGVAVAQSENPLSARIEETKTKIAEMTTALQAAQQQGDKIDVATLEAGLQKAREDLARLQSQMTEGGRKALDAQLEYGQVLLQSQLSDLKQHVAAENEALQQSIDAAHEATQIKSQMAQDEFERNSEYLTRLAATNDRVAKDQSRSWQNADREIESVEGRLVDNIVMGRRTLGQSIVSMGAEFLAQEIQQDLKAVTTRLLLANTAATQEKAIEQGGFLYHALVESQKTAATVTGEAARTAARSAGAASSHAVAAAAGAKTVMQDAAKAYSGTYASVAQIPYVGWILAPAAAAGAFAAVAAYQGLASLDVGAWNVPRDMVAQIHAGEMVVPATFAQGMRANGGVGAGESHHYHGNVNVSAFNSRDVSRLFKGSGYRGALVGGLTRAARRGAFSPA